MQFYPHNISTSLVGSAVSASQAQSTLFLNNFSAMSINIVNTASVALNITGSRGADGTSITVPGPKGPAGARGVTGFRGNSVFLLSGSWHSGAACSTPPANCFEHRFYPTYVIGGNRFCDFSDYYDTYYSTDLNLQNGVSKIYFNEICTTLASNAIPLGAYGPTSTAYNTDGAGTLEAIEPCQQQPF